MANKSSNVTTKDKVLVCLIIIIIALLSSLITSIIMYAIDGIKDNEPIKPVIQVEQDYEEDKDESQYLALDSSILPQHYVLTAISGSDTITHNIFVNKITYKEDGSYVVETSSGDNINFRDGVCIIHYHNGLVEIFTEYSFTLKNTN